VPLSAVIEREMPWQNKDIQRYTKAENWLLADLLEEILKEIPY
jgi:hypothetical protein